MAAGGLTQVSQFPRRADWRGVAAFIETGERPGEPIFVVPPLESYSMKFVYRGVNSIGGMPRDYPSDRYMEDSSAFSPESAYADRLATSVAPGAAFWFVAYDKTGSVPVRATLDAFIARRARVVARAEYRGVRVWRLERSGAAE
jgi:hypothetical protein